MPLTEDERRYFDEKFSNLNDKITSVLHLIPRVTKLEIEMQRRPTVFQIIIACGFFLSLGFGLGAAIF